MIPVVAIVGRVNVGKSMLFNRIVGKMKAIVSELPEVTRDRNLAKVKWEGCEFNVVDTGGITDSGNGPIGLEIQKQTKLALEEADAVVFVVDGAAGLNPYDEEIAEMLRKKNAEVIVAVNKMDKKKEFVPYEFEALPFAEKVQISSAHGNNVDVLMSLLTEKLKRIEKNPAEDLRTAVKITIAGKPNVGKSSILNFLVGQERVIVDEKPGTTRDSIDCNFSIDGKNYTIIDTAGMRKKEKVNESIEYYGVNRAIKAIKESNIVLLVCDIIEGVNEQDKKVFSIVEENGKGCIILMNKVDLLKRKTGKNSVGDEIAIKLAKTRNYPVILTSAKTGEGLDTVFSDVDRVYANYTRTIGTREINKLISDFQYERQPPSGNSGKRLKIYYAVQTGVKPPEFTFFVNDRAVFGRQYERYIINRLRENYDFSGSPVNVKIKNSGEKKK